MAFNRKNWQDNVSDITAAELNRMEQGIYDNSLVVDAVTNTLNPTDTETYKTAELTEGQITDVIGISDIVIQGNTEQNGTPTPSAPVDVNVVSGSNVINTSNKNWLKTQRLTTKTLNGITFTPVYTGKTLNYINVNGTATATTVYEFEDVDIGNPSEYISKLSAGSYILSDYSGTSSSANSTYIRYTTNGSTFEVKNSVSDKTLTLNQDCKYIAYIRIQSGNTFSNMKFKPQLEKSSTATTYEPHQGKELPLDLPVENLINPQNLELYGNYRYVKSADDYYINVNANTAYTFSIKEFTGDGRLYEYDKDNNLLKENQLYSALTNGYITIITTENTKKIRFYAAMYSSTPTEIPTVYTPQCMLFKGPLPSPYTPYGTDPIELCKIGDYQDYFYKSGSKWYLHKEIGKVVLNGTESWTADSNGQRAYSSVIADNVLRPTTNDIVLIGLCDKLQVLNFTDVYINKRDGLSSSTSGTLSLHITGVTDITFNENDFKTWLSSNNITLYYALATATNTEITDTTLISQLEAMYNAPLYEETNITQTNNDLPMVLDITACKDNINGIKAFIRK